jgi:uncharacterized protein (DUF2384 family)
MATTTQNPRRLGGKLTGKRVDNLIGGLVTQATPQKMSQAKNAKTKAIAEFLVKDAASVIKGASPVFEGRSTTRVVTKRAEDRFMVLRGNADPASIFRPYQGRYLHEVIEIERGGVPARAFLRTTEKLKLPSSRVLQIFNIPKSTAAHKIKMGTRFEGTEALASLRLEKLLALAQSIASNSLHPDAKKFDSGKWLGEWIESPQPALGGIKPSELLDTEAGGQRVYQVLAAIESGSYQ